MVLQRTMTRSRQRGMSFIGLIFMGLFIVAAFAIVGQSVPVFIEYVSIQKAAKKAAKEGSSVAEVRAIFDRAAAIDNISTITGKDLEVAKRNDKIIVSFHYEREIALAGPAYLVYRFRESTN